MINGNPKVHCSGTVSSISQLEGLKGLHKFLIHGDLLCPNATRKTRRNQYEMPALILVASQLR